MKIKTLPELSSKPESEIPSVSNVLADRAGWYGPCKVLAEFVFSLILLVLTTPLLLVVALLVKLTSRGPAFYKQTRVGKNGQTFTLYKVRTMRDDSERHGAQWSRPGDTRITGLGRILRTTHLDELPQLWNVLRGDMSLIGPRPERPEFVPLLAEAIRFYRDRLLVRPGVTGLAQVHLPADTDMDSVRRKITYDLFYVAHRGPWLDLRIIIATALKMFGIPLSWLGRICWMPGATAIEEAFQSWHGRSGRGRFPTVPLSRAVDGVERFVSPLVLNPQEGA
jgi:lipopolysaccharide/colanic/teichoic acid biosynthesis glycosyltransferase